MNATLAVSTVSETVEVTAESVADFGQKAQVSTNFKQELVETLPLSRTFQSAAILTPGVQVSGPSGAMAISGAMSFENLFMINGVVVQDNLRSTPLNLFIEDALQETTTTTAAVSAEYGRFGGGVVNAITKSGGNELSGSFRLTLENDDWTALTPYPNDTRTDDVVPTYEATLGGPILKDKLWFFGATRLRDFTGSRSTNTTLIAYPRELDEKRYEGKLTFSPTARHTFKGAYSWIDSSRARQQLRRDHGRGERREPAAAAAAALAQLHRGRQPELLRRGAVLLALVQVRELGLAVHRPDPGHAAARPVARQQPLQLADLLRRLRPRGRDNQDVVAEGVVLPVDEVGRARTALVGGVDVFDDKRFANNHQSGSDFRIFTAPRPSSRARAIFPVLRQPQLHPLDPIFEGSAGQPLPHLVVLQRRVALDKHWSFNLGLRYDKNDGKDGSGNVVVKDSGLEPAPRRDLRPEGRRDLDRERVVRAST